MSIVPKLPWRLTTLLALWFFIFGMIIAMNPVAMEGGYNVTHENLMATLMSPILGCMGLATFIGGPQITGFPGVLALFLSVLLILGPTALMVFRCRNLLVFWTLTVAHLMIVTTASFGFIELIRYCNETP
jgi:hypothetical protein